MSVELVVFDLAGTTVKDNFDVHRIMQKALAGFDIQISLEDANAVMGLPKPIAIYELMKANYKGARSVTQGLIHEIHREFVAEMVNFYRTDPGVAE